VRGFRKAVEISIPIVGMLVVFGGVLLISPTRLQLQMIVVLVGVLMIEAGVWGMTKAILPNERQYVALRKEGDRFIGLIRKLNAAKVDFMRDDSDPNRTAVEVSRENMHASVDTMAEVAGQRK
jgi:hypothetical protein